jgi:hypothetical protein
MSDEFHRLLVELDIIDDANEFLYRYFSIKQKSNIQTIKAHIATIVYNLISYDEKQERQRAEKQERQRRQKQERQRAEKQQQQQQQPYSKQLLKNDTMRRLYLSYKGADSIDIGRSEGYIATYNPLSKYKKYETLYDEDMVYNYTILTSLFNKIIKKDKQKEISNDIDLKILKLINDDNDEKIFKIKIVNKIENDDDILSLFMDGELEYAIDWGTNKIKKSENLNLNLSISEKIDENYKKYCYAIAYDIVSYFDTLYNDIHTHCKEIIQNFNRNGKIHENGFDLFCTFIYSFIYVLPVYHRYLSYLKIPFKSRLIYNRVI